MGREFELKFQATEEILAAVAKKYGDFTPISMETTYFDTKENALAARRITLRRRMENGVSVCTVKTPLPDGSRGEWEVIWQEPATMVEQLCAAGAPMELQKWTAGGISPVCGAKFTRLAKTLSLRDCTLELALDRGVLMGGGRQIPLCELEVELKSGEDAAAVAFAQALAEEFGLVPEKNSKFRRAQSLSRGE